MTQTVFDVNAVIDGLDREREVYVALQGLSARQLEVMGRNGSLEDLLSILGRKQMLLGRVGAIDRELEPFKREWEVRRESLPGETRAAIEDRLDGLRLLIGELLAAEETGRRKLVERSGESAAPAQPTTQKAQARRAYAPRPVSLRSVCESALRGAVGELARTNIVVRREYSRPDVTVEADPDLLQRALLNLILNAVQAMEHEGELIVRTSFVCTGEPGSCRIEVVDSGPGIAPDIQDRLFEPYVTGKPGSTGLGLTIVRKIVESHGGQAAGGNGEARGARFVVTLPLKQQPKASA